MDDLNNQILIVQDWLAKLQENAEPESLMFNTTQATLNEMVRLIKHDTSVESREKTISETYDELERRVQEQTTALDEATSTLRTHIDERETAARNLRKAYNNLEDHLRSHNDYQSRLNQRLHEQIEEQRQNQIAEQEERTLNEALRDTLATMSNTLDLDKILDHILDTIKRVTPYDGANILLVESDLVHVARQKGYVEKDAEKSWLNQRFPLIKLASLQHLIDVEKAIAVPDTSVSSMWIGLPGLDWVSSNVTAPIRSNGKTLGFLSLDSATKGHFNQAHADRLQSFADQAAIAIQNARLLDRAKHKAMMAERNRLANELHDTISQTLWSISLISERLPDIWDINEEEARRVLSTLYELSQSALAEMRSLLLELHPLSLTEVQLGVLIRQVAEITTNRTGLSISVTIENEDPMPPDVHFALYRVVQEALNNVILHASASEAKIYFNSHEASVMLTVEDDGIGFDPAEIEPGHLGLSIMQDRIKNIGGILNINSHKDGGTLIQVTWARDLD